MSEFLGLLGAVVLVYLLYLFAWVLFTIIGIIEGRLTER